MATDTRQTTGLAAGRLQFRLGDPGHDHAGVRVYQEIARPRDGLRAEWTDGVWTASIPVPEVTRVEYAFIVEHGDGGQSFITDPDNPQVVPGVFGEKSVLTLPGYAPPTWLEGPPPEAGSTTSTTLPLPRYRQAMPVAVWQPAGLGPLAPAPLLIAHDGPEYDHYSGLTRFLAHEIEEGRLPPLRAALLAPLPGRRDLTYSGSNAYADALAFTVLPWLARTAPTPGGHRPILMGASLGALACLHAAHRHPARYGALYLQSGSYFQPDTDGQESGFTHFDRVSRVVGVMLEARRTAHPIPVAMTCGTIEENLDNNIRMAAALEASGHQVALRRHPDGHTYAAWRDTFDPHLRDLLTAALGGLQA